MSARELEIVKDYLLENIPPSVTRLRKARGAPPNLLKVPELGLLNLISDVVDEMRTRRPYNPFNIEHTVFPSFMPQRPGQAQEGKEKLKALSSWHFELLCCEVCSEIERRYPVNIPPDPAVAPDQAQKWQILNAAEGDWSESEVSLDEGRTDDELASSAPSNTRDGRSPRVDLEQTSTELELVCNKLMDIFQDRSRYKLLLGYRDLEAQAVLDLLQNLLDSPRVRNSRLKKELVVAIQRLSKRSGLYPECFVLKNISIEKNTDGSIHALSSGKFGEVWRGSMQGQDVCLKVMRVYRNSKIHELLKAFTREAVLWSQLRHTNVLPFYGVYRLEHPSHDRICLVSPWMINGNISEFLANEPDVDRIALTIDIASGLKYLHARDVIHGDLKGANVLVDSLGRACLADFGLSTMRDPEVMTLTTTDTGDSAGGTIRWMAPELLNPQDEEPLNTKECDIYSFAGVSYEIFTGHVPFYEVFRDQTVIVKINRGERPSRPDESVFSTSGLTEPIWKLMQDCWLTEPEDRPTASEIVFKLTSVHKRSNKPRITSNRTPTSGRSTPRQEHSLPPSQNKLSLSPVLFRASFAQPEHLENQLRRKELLRLLDVSTVPLLGGPPSATL